MSECVLEFYLQFFMDNKDAKERLAEIIKRARGDKTQGSFAKSLGVSQPTIASWEKGESFPGTNSMRVIADAVGMTLDDLLSYLQGDSAQMNRLHPKIAEEVLAIAEELTKEERVRLMKLLIDKLAQEKD